MSPATKEQLVSAIVLIAVAFYILWILFSVSSCEA